MKHLRFLVPVLLLGACSSDGSIDSDEAARRAYLGLDAFVGKSIGLGFDGFNSASSANIAPQMTTGVEDGVLTVTGQVDQGSSDNKGMRLVVAMTAYTDGAFEIDADHHTIDVVYDADTTTLPALEMQLKNIPTGTLTGTLIGLFHLSGDLDGDVTLNLVIAGQLADGGNGDVIRAPGTTTITGTAVQGDGTYDVMVTR
jgi:hypothetical protein